LQPTSLIWDVISGRGAAELADPAASRPIVYHPPEMLLRLDELIVSAELGPRLHRLASLVDAGEVDLLVVRGPRHNGRKTLLGGLARHLGLGLLELSQPSLARTPGRPGGAPGEASDEPWRLLGPLATLLHALPVVTLELAPGETTVLPRLAAYRGPLAVAMGRYGGLQDRGQVLTVMVDMPLAAERLAHWQRAFGEDARGTDPGLLAARFRLTSGAIHRTARLARTWAALDGNTSAAPGQASPAVVRASVTATDVQRAARALNRQALETLAQPVRVGGTWSDLACRPETLDELLLLQHRCRYRERLATDGGSAFAARAETGPSIGVRALFTGPSGTGKTLAARILASALAMDLYRVDLSSVVNKYIGETEKNLNELFTRAEELDVLLLIDEGDALLTQRTNVQTSNDRYANLETNFLLQRLETYSGIVVVTTNAGERIDSAFQRRMDVVIEFRAPEPTERWALWQLHLPASHLVDDGLLREMAARCALTGGQIRNTVLHASVLALEDGGCITSAHMEAALRREYRRIGGVCPLRVQ
jgi:hypothetical protein